MSYIGSIVVRMMRHFVDVTIYIQLQFLFEKLHANFVWIYPHGNISNHFVQFCCEQL